MIQFMAEIKRDFNMGYEKDYGLRIPKERYLIGYEGYKKGSV